MAKACTICRKNDARLLYHHRHFLVLRCRRCGLVYVDSRLPASEERKLGLQAIREGPSYIARVYESQRNLWLNYFADKLNEIEKLEPVGRILDIGCGPGYFVEVAARRGWEAYGLETSSQQAEYARTILGLDVMDRTLEQAGFPPGYFDVVTMYSVIEHVPDPRALLENVHTVLREGGLVVVKTPNQDSVISRLACLVYHASLGHYLLPIYSHEHLFRFSPATIERLLQVTHFAVLRVDLEDNLELLRLRAAPSGFQGLAWYGIAWVVHQLARVSRRHNQIIAYSRKMPHHLPSAQPNDVACQKDFP